MTEQGTEMTCDGCGDPLTFGEPHECPVLGTTVTVEPID